MDVSTETGVCVLIVEDDDDFRGMLSEFLATMGHHVLEAADLHQALERATANNWDIAMIDLHLPGVDGCEVARCLRAGDQGRSRRLVALTGFSDPATRFAAHAAGFDEFIVKPVYPEQLIKILQGCRVDRDSA